MSKCLNLSDKNIKALADAFGEVQASKILDEFPDRIPSVEEAKSTLDGNVHLNTKKLVANDIGLNLNKEYSGAQFLNLNDKIKVYNTKYGTKHRLTKTFIGDIGRNVVKIDINIDNNRKINLEIQNTHFNGKTKSTLKDVLESIVNNTKGKTGNRLLAIDLLKALTEENLKVPVSLETFDDDGEYNPTTRSIRINQTLETMDEAEKVILHEASHALTHSAYRHNTEFRNAINTLLAKARKQLDGKLFEYQLSSGDEFIAGAFDNKNGFANELLKTSTEDTKTPSNLFKEFVDLLVNFFKKIFNIKRGNLLENLMYELEKLGEQNKLHDDNNQYSFDFEEPLASPANKEEKTYGDFETINGMPFQHSTIDKMSTGEQRITIRQNNHKSGNYKIGNNTYNIINLGRKKITSFKNKEYLRKKFKGDEELTQSHIKDFFEGKKGMYVYQITKIDNSIKNEHIKLDEQLENDGKTIADDNKEKSRAFERQYTLLKRQLNRLKRELGRITDKTSDEYEYKESEYLAAKEKLELAAETESRKAYVDIGKEQLFWVEQLIVHLPKHFDKYTLEHIQQAFDILNTFDDDELEDLASEAKRLRKELFPFIQKFELEGAIKNATGKSLTEEDLNDFNKDIRWSSKAFGSLSDVNNPIAMTVGHLIKTAQNTASTLNHTLEQTIQKEVDKLREYGKKANMSLEQIYDLFLQENKQGTLVLTQKYDKDGEINENYNRIMSTQELKDFFIFYKKVLRQAEANLPYKVGPNYVLNKAKGGLKEDLKKLIPVSDMLFDSFVSNEELIADMIPDMYRNPIPADKKSRDLGSGLLQFAAYANNHNELSKVLPETRLLQEMLKYKTENGKISRRTYQKSSDPTDKVYAEQSNVWNMTNTVIDMQLKGKMKDNKTKPIKLKEIFQVHIDKNVYTKIDGEWKKQGDKNKVSDEILKKINDKIKNNDVVVIGYKQIHIEDIIDKMLRWNSLLRIGLSPITALTNVIFGDISNTLEAIGGKHFTFKELNKATWVFNNQISYISDKKETPLYEWLNKLNPLQELADYELGENLTANPKKLTHEKALEMMYSMQKKGELYLQSRTMLAVLIHEGYMTENGKTTPKGEALTKEQLTQLSDKIQRLNQLIHGRYSQREAATLNQEVWFRAAIQFRKWIPSAIEARFGDNKYDYRLMTDVEGRYRTLGNKVFKARSVKEAFENLFLPILNSKAALERGNMTKTEIYNMRKNIVELIGILTCVLLMAGLKSGDDDKRKKRLKNPMVKTLLTMLNRTAGDLNFFYNPSNIANIASNAVPMSKLMGDIIKVGLHLPHAVYLGDSQIKRGSLKGFNSFWAKDIEKIIPGFAPGGQIQRIANSTDILQELN